MKNILITGGLGFIGFNAIQLWKKEHPEYNYFVIDIETYAAQFMLEEKHKWLKANDVTYFKCNICDEFSVEALVKQYAIDTIVHFAAESHVDNSITGPDVFFQTNVIGTTKLLNIAKKYDLRFHQIGTDEVYGETFPESWNVTIPDGKGHALLGTMLNYENMPLKPSSPYSSSKASADLIALSYHRTFGTKVTVSRCSNNYGPWQMTEKLIPTVICKALKNQKIPVYGNGLQKRHWIHVDDHNTAIMDILQNGEIGKIYNIAPSEKSYVSNMSIILDILDCLEKSSELIEHVTDRLGHDKSYYMVSENYTYDTDLKTMLKKTVEWYTMQMSKH